MAYHLVHPSPPELVPCLSPDRGLASVPGAAGAPCSQAREGFETNVSGRLVPGNINTSAGGGTRRDNSSAPQVYSAARLQRWICFLEEILSLPCLIGAPRLQCRKMEG